MIYARYLLKALSREPLPYALAALLALALLVPLVVGGEAFGSQTLIDEAMAYEPYTEERLRDLPPDASAAERQMNERIMEARRASVAGEDAAFYEAMEGYFEAEGRAEAASPGATPHASAYAACAERLCAWLAEHPESGLAGTAQLPLLSLVPAAMGALSVIWFAPAALVALLEGAATRRERLLGTAPLSGRARYLWQLAAGSVAIAAVLALSTLPAGLFALIANGMGDPGYPIVFTRAGEVVQTTALAATVDAWGLILLGNALLLAVGLGAGRLFGDARAGAGVALALALLPALGVYYGNPLVSPEALALIPVSYFDVPRVVGFAGADPVQSVASLAPAALAPARGLFVLGVSFAAVAFGASLLAGGDRSRRRAAAGPVALVAWDVDLAYGRHVVYEGADFLLRPGEVRGFVAPNGWGKTTLMRALAEQPLRGRRAVALSVDGRIASDVLVRRELLYVASDGELLHPALTPREHLELARGLWHAPCKVGAVADLLAISSYLDRPVRKLSQGMRQQTALAVALMCGARYLLLDEPTNGLDLHNVRVFERAIQTMARQGRGILVSSHLLGTIDGICDGFYLIRDHRLVWLKRRGAGTWDAARLKRLYARFYRSGDRPVESGPYTKVRKSFEPHSRREVIAKDVV